MLSYLISFKPREFQTILSHQKIQISNINNAKEGKGLGFSHKLKKVSKTIKIILEPCELLLKIT